MNGYERTKRVLDGGTADRVPMMLHCFMSAVEEAGIDHKSYRESARLISDSHIRYAEKYGLDGILIDVDTCVEADAIGVKVDYPDNAPARIHSGNGMSIEDIRRALDKKRLYESKRVETILESVRLSRERVGGELFIRGNCDQMGFSLVMLAYGMADFMMDLLDEDVQDDISELIDKATDFHTELHRLTYQAGADMTSFGDSSCGPDLISPEMYRKFAFPFHKKLSDTLKNEGIPSLIHICGNLDLICEDIAQLGFAGVELDYKTNITRAAEVFSGKSTVFGIIDPSGVFCLGSEDDIRNETQRVLDTFKGRNLVIGAGCALPPATPEKNIRAFVDTVKSYNLT
ncbi:MAG: uroporphyrinogen decarboxylase family protein [Eubacteriales bacterium]|nr:uroporphyrinogen decarboxylase family protein [Eubacteriales bacterium]